MKNTLWILDQASGIFSYAWFITLSLIILSGISFVLIKKKDNLLSIRHVAFLIYPISLPVIIAFLGNAFSDTSNKFIQNLIIGLLILNLIYNIWVIVKVKGYRLFFFSVLAILLFFTLSTAFVSGMSIVNDWI